jgi:hypothetical protein
MMPSTAVKLVIDDPENFHLLTTDMKEMIIKGAIATVNVQAALARKNAVENIKSDFILRNNFTTAQVQYTQMEKKRLISLSAIESKTGITEKAAYMARQETGGPHKPENGTTLAIPTYRARGGNKGSPVLKNYYLHKVKKVKGGGFTLEGQTYRSWFVRKAAVASKNNLIMRHNDKLFSVTDFHKKSDGGIEFKMQQIYGFDKKETITPESPWLKPAGEKPAQDVENIFISQMKKLGM